MEEQILLDWVRANPVDIKYTYKECFNKFILLIWEIKNNFRMNDNDILCIEEHTSKSIKFPTVQINYKGKKYIIDYNTFFFSLKVDKTDDAVNSAYEFYHRFATILEKNND